MFLVALFLPPLFIPAADNKTCFQCVHNGLIYDIFKVSAVLCRLCCLFNVLPGRSCRPLYCCLKISCHIPQYRLSCFFSCPAASCFFSCPCPLLSQIPRVPDRSDRRKWCNTSRLPWSRLILPPFSHGYGQNHIIRHAARVIRSRL